MLRDTAPPMKRTNRIPQIIIFSVLYFCIASASDHKTAYAYRKISTRNYGIAQGGRYDLDDYLVSWEWECRADDIGSNVKIKPRYGGKPYIVYLPDRVIVSITEWYAPQRQSEESALTGVEIRCSYLTGSSREYLIFGCIHGKWKKVFDTSSGTSGDAHGIESVDIDGDTYPELIVTKTFHYASDASELLAQVWKWSPKEDEYIRLDTVPYLQRLRNRKSAFFQ